MNEGTRNIVIVVFQYSVVVKGIERKIRDAGYEVSILAEDFDKIVDLEDDTDLFLLYLPGDILENRDRIEELSAISEEVKKSGSKMILIGEPKDRIDLILKISVIGNYTWLNRPIEMDALRPAIENAITGKDLKKRILIVDDDPSYAKMVREWIKDDYHADIVTAGMQAITFLLKNKADLVLLDYEMPVVDGPGVLQMLRQEPETRDIPVVFLTGVGSKDSVQRVMELKPAGYILKSTTRENLLEYLKGKLV